MPKSDECQQKQIFAEICRAPCFRPLTRQHQPGSLRRVGSPSGLIEANLMSQCFTLAVRAQLEAAGSTVTTSTVSVARPEFSTSLNHCHSKDKLDHHIRGGVTQINELEPLCHSRRKTCYLQEPRCREVVALLAKGLPERQVGGTYTKMLCQDFR